MFWFRSYDFISISFVTGSFVNAITSKFNYTYTIKTLHLANLLIHRFL